MKLKTIRLAVIAALLASVSLTTAATPHTKGGYIEANIGTLYASINLFGYEFSQLGSIGLNTNAGYQFSQNLALEMGYTNYGVSSLNNIDGALKVIFPFELGNKDASLFVKAGPAFIFTNDGSTITPFLGVGASYALTDKVDATLQAQGISEGFFSLGLISAGLTYHFD